MRKEHIYNEGEKVGGIIILSQQRVRNRDGYKEKAYRCKCIKCNNYFIRKEEYLKKSIRNGLSGCPKCALNNKKYKLRTGFTYNIGDMAGNLKITKRYREKIKDTSYKFYEYECTICGYKGKNSQGNLKKTGNKCPACAGQVAQKGFNDITTTDPWMIKFFIGGEEEASNYTYGSDSSIYMKCPDCGRKTKNKVRIADLYRNKRIHCICGDGMSYPEKFMYSCLEQLNLDFKKEYSPEWARYSDGRKMRYDFYISSKNMIVEMDGGIGHGNKYTGIGKDDKSSLNDDLEKDNIAIQYGISVKRVDCIKSERAYIEKEIRNSSIFTQEELECINFKISDEAACSNRAKSMCEEWENNKDVSLKELANKHKMGYHTLVRYIKKGCEFGWCSGYDTEEQRKKGGESRSIKTAVLKDGEIIKIYDSGRKLIENSEQDFGVKFSNSIVIDYLKGRRLIPYKGYTFKYI